MRYKRGGVGSSKLPRATQSDAHTQQAHCLRGSGLELCHVSIVIWPVLNKKTNAWLGIRPEPLFLDIDRFEQRLK